MKKIFITLLILGIIITNLRFLIYDDCLNVYAFDERCSAESMVVMERTTGRILYSKAKDKILPMASTTKINTAIVAIEHCTNLDEKHLITKEMTGIEGSSIYLKAGERLSIRELLYGLMLRSGNDAAVAIAKIVSGSVENFVKLMNEFCSKQNLTNTNIVTVNGLHDKNHYTSASDLAKISCYALMNNVFREIVSTKEKVISNDMDKKNKCRLLKNKNRLLKILDGADGVKTGYTTKAGRCFVGSVTRDEFQVVCVVLNCREMFEETERLINKALGEYRLELVQIKGKIKVDENGFKLQNSNIFVKNNTFLPLKHEELKKLETRFEFFDKPLEDGQIGFQYFLVENNLIFSEKIYTILNEKSEDKNGFRVRFEKVIKAF